MSLYLLVFTLRVYADTVTAQKPIGQQAEDSNQDWDYTHAKRKESEQHEGPGPPPRIENERSVTPDLPVHPYSSDNELVQPTVWET